ncbi:hypothetical protein [Sphingomonas sp. LT1P40]|uniref:hypothetical protein n=1 Tax=Alteristakelama amylovorans TaxID=3096166 RepID=UPI002FCBC63C
MTATVSAGRLRPWRIRKIAGILAALLFLYLLITGPGRQLYMFGQLPYLTDNIPNTNCTAARFALVEESVGLLGDGYVKVAIHGLDCAKSIRTSLAANGAREVYIAEGLGGLAIPGKHRLLGRPEVMFKGPVLNAFAFGDDGITIWLRYSE